MALLPPESLLAGLCGVLGKPANEYDGDATAIDHEIDPFAL